MTAPRGARALCSMTCAAQAAQHTMAALVRGNAHEREVQRSVAPSARVDHESRKNAKCASLGDGLLGAGQAAPESWSAASNSVAGGMAARCCRGAEQWKRHVTTVSR